MLGSSAYATVDDFDGEHRRMLEELLHADENMIYGIDAGRTGQWSIRKTNQAKLVLTDARILEFRTTMLKEYSRAIALEKVDTIEFSKKLVYKMLRIEGKGFSGEYSVDKEPGKTFAKKSRSEMRTRRER